MIKIVTLSFVTKLKLALAEDRPLIQVILGPRQVGKTTGVQLYLDALNAGSYAYCSADGDVARAPNWVLEQWQHAELSPTVGVLVIDEIQKVENWSEMIKMLWDRQANNKKSLKLILLGSSSLEIQNGLTESLAGRFQAHHVYHWNFPESREAYGLSLEDYLIYGGYPGSYRFVGDRSEWLQYMRTSIINPVVGKDILSQHRVKSPALFRQFFDIVCSYPAQEISYTKLLGQLQDRGNTDLIKYYLGLFEGAFLIKQIPKYSSRAVISRTSSPKILPMCPALYAATLDADLNAEQRGRSFELAVGAMLARLPGRLYYWRLGNDEVDYIYVYGNDLYAIEVKSGRKKSAQGLQKFVKNHPTAKALIVTPGNFLEMSF